jgi:hypothetical protein
VDASKSRIGRKSRTCNNDRDTSNSRDCNNNRDASNNNRDVSNIGEGVGNKMDASRSKGKPERAVAEFIDPARELKPALLWC